MELVGQDGKRTPLSSKDFRLDHGQSRGGESLVDVSQRKGFVIDPGTMEAIRRMNPNIGSAISPLPAGETLTFVKPGDPVELDTKLAVVPGSRPLTPLAFQTQRSQIADVKTEVRKASGQPQFSVAQYQRLQVATDRIEKASAVFETKATTMTARQQILAAAQLDAATAQIRSATSIGSPDQLPEAIGASAALAADAEGFARSLSSGSRKLKVVVHPATVGRPPAPLAVYLLPLALVTYGRATDETKLRNLIGALAFAQPTSPSQGEVEPGVKYAVWIGPRHSVELMAALVKRGAVRKYVPVDATTTSLADAVFEEADQVGAP